jgi:hypothetical protein
MQHFSPDEQRFLRGIAHKVVAQIAPKELPLFDELVEEFFRNPTALLPAYHNLDDPLAWGLSDIIMAATRVTLLMGGTALTYIQQSDRPHPHNTGAAPPPTTIRQVLRDQHQRDELRQLVYQTGRTLHMTSDKVMQVADELIRALEDSAAEHRGPQRVINAWLDADAPDQPLHQEQVYQLNFNVDLPRTDALAMAERIEELTAALPPDQDYVDLIIILEADASIFSILTENPQPLRVPRRGPSDTIAFTIQPHRAGRHTITALVALHNQIFQRMEITLEIHSSEPYRTQMHVQTSGRPLEQELQQPASPHSMSLVIMSCLRGYQFLLLFDSWYRAPVTINISQAEITTLVQEARTDLHKYILNKVGGADERIYQCEDTFIPLAIHEQALQDLVQIGRNLYKKLFYAGRSEEVRALGNLLRREMRTKQFHIDIVTVDNAFIFPWAWLYLGEDHEPIDPEAFWGFKHLIACKPGLNESIELELDSELSAEPLHLGFVYNAGSGARPERQRMAQRQRQLFQQLPNVTLSDYVDRQTLLNLLNDPNAAPHILYFYCHDVTRNTSDPAALYQSELALTDGAVTIRDLDRLSDDRFRQAPLVFLNACGSARLKPYGSEGLVPYMIKRGARGVLGTEIEIPIYFSAEFGQELLRRLIMGTATLGEIILQLRREFLFERHNLLGLLYTAYCNSDLRVRERRRA